MGIIQCQKHGMQGFFEVCGHISDEYDRDIYKEYREFCLGEFYGILVCDECWKINKLDDYREFWEMTEDEFSALDEEDQNQKTDQWSKIYNSVNRRLCCVQCVAEVRVKQARKNKEPLPFPVFEKTLTVIDRKKIAEIENHLISELQIEKYAFNPQPHYKNENCLSGHKTLSSMHIRPRAFTYPLLVSIHSVTSENRQNEIIDFIERIFGKEENNQVKIEFRDDDDWIFNENFEQILHYKAKQGNILREVYLNC